MARIAVVRDKRDKSTSRKSKSRRNRRNKNRSTSKGSSRNSSRSSKTLSSKKSSNSVKNSASQKTQKAVEKKKAVRHAISPTSTSKSWIEPRSERSMTPSMEQNANRSGKKDIKADSSREPVVNEKDIVLVCRGEKIPINSDNMLNLSKTMFSCGNKLRSIELSAVDPSTARVLAAYINYEQLPQSISFYTLGQLLKLSRGLGLVELLNKLEKILLTSMNCSIDYLTESLLVAAHVPLSTAAEGELLECAAANFSLLISVPQFIRVPYEMLLALVSRCDLDVQAEIQVADAVLFWLSQQSCGINFAAGLFSALRIGFLGVEQKTAFNYFLNTMGFSSAIVASAYRIFDSGHCGRLCLQPAHQDTVAYPRCGMPDSNRPVNKPLMPLCSNVLPAAVSDTVNADKKTSK